MFCPLRGFFRVTVAGRCLRAPPLFKLIFMPDTNKAYQTRLYRGVYWTSLSTKQRQFVEQLQQVYELPIERVIPQLQQLDQPRGIKTQIKDKKITIMIAGHHAATIRLPQKAKKSTAVIKLTDRLPLWEKVQERRGAIAHIARIANTTEATVRGFLSGSFMRSKKEQDIMAAAIKVLGEATVSDLSPTPSPKVWLVWIRGSHIDKGWLTPKNIQTVRNLAQKAQDEQMDQAGLWELAQTIELPGYTVHKYKTGVAWMRGKLQHSTAIGVKIY